MVGDTRVRGGSEYTEVPGISVRLSESSAAQGEGKVYCTEDSAHQAGVRHRKCDVYSFVAGR
eukprot:7823426-Alexandrium_andersonii.AAC.1